MVNLIKLVKYLYDENFKTEKEEIIEDTKRWKDLSCSWIVTNHTVKNAHSAQTIHVINEIPIKVSMPVIIEYK